VTDKVRDCLDKNNRSVKVEKAGQIFGKMGDFIGFSTMPLMCRSPWYFLLLIILTCSACSYNKKNYAPVRKSDVKLISNARYHIVKKGDTLSLIGFSYGHSYLHLAEWNHISAPYRIHVGQKIKLFRPKNSQPKKIKIVKKTPKRRTASQNTTKKERNASQKKSILSNTKKNLLKLVWQWPMRGTLEKTFSQSGNKGIDISGKIGQSIKAAADGKVVYRGSGLIGYGNLLIIKHNYLYLSAYANNRRLLVVEGQDIKKGQAIAEMGLGKNKKAVLHFEIRKNGKSVNPLNYLP
jgi:lipoprotein NlpD